MPGVIYKPDPSASTLELAPGDVVVVPFPFADRDATRRRPALVISAEPFNRASGTVVLAMITTAQHSAWPGDTGISDLAAAGLRVPCVVRWKIATRDVSHVAARLGTLSRKDRTAVRRHLESVVAV